MNSVLGSGTRNGKLKCYGVSGLEGDRFPFRNAKPLGPCTRNPTSHISWYPRLFSGRFTEPNRFPAGTATPAWAEILFGSVNRGENTRGYQDICVVRFRVRGNSFGLAPRNGGLSPSVPETPEPLNSPSRARNPERSSYSNSLQNLGSVGQSLGSQYIYTQR